MPARLPTWPFRPRGLSASALVKVANLCAAAMAALYILWVLPLLIRVGPEGPSPVPGPDYQVILASADIAATYGFAEVYNLDLQRVVQERRRGEVSDPSTNPGATPILYLPIFVALFQVLLLPPPAVSYWLWTAVSVVAVFLVLRSWDRGSTRQDPGSLVPSLLLCEPALVLFFLGQVDVLTLLALSQFLRAGLKEADLRSGLWLSGLLLKPQTLLVIGPGLLLARRWRCLAGLAAGSLILLGASLAVGGADAMVAQMMLWQAAAFGSTGTPVITGPPLMANWRAFGLHIVDALGPRFTWPLIGAASAATYLAALWLWRSRTRPTGAHLALIVMASYAAACSVAPHAHVSMSLPLVAPLAYLVRVGLVPVWIGAIWSVGPMALVIRNIVIAIFDPPFLGPGTTNLGMLFANLLLVVWAAWVVGRQPVPPARGIAHSRG